MGARWRIGDGSSIKNFQDAWIPGNNSGRVLSPVSMLSENSTADQLIDKESRWWNSSLIDSIFYPLKLRKLSPYLYVPHHRKMFCFGHILQMVCIQLSQGIICSVNRVAEMQLQLLTLLTKNFWLHLWKLKVPNKVKSFLWRAFSNSIPTMQNLLK